LSWDRPYTTATTFVAQHAAAAVVLGLTLHNSNTIL
jgi:hypothetical protein